MYISLFSHRFSLFTEITSYLFWFYLCIHLFSWDGYIFDWNLVLSLVFSLLFSSFVVWLQQGFLLVLPFISWGSLLIPEIEERFFSKNHIFSLLNSSIYLFLQSFVVVFILFYRYSLFIVSG